MTNQEAIHILIRLQERLNWEVTDSQKKMDALNMAIKALERMAPPDCERVKSLTHEERAEDEEVITLHKGALKAVTGRFVVYDREWLKKHFNTTEAYLYGINVRDLISRQAVIESLKTDYSLIMFDSYGNLTFAGERIIEVIKRVPSVEQERKTGKWVHMVGWWECNQCHAEYTDMPTCMGKVIYEYCPMCGCRMKEVEE